MIKKTLITIVIIGVTIIGLKAQTVPSPAEAYINMELLNPQILSDAILDTLLDPMSILTPTDTLKISLTMLLADTNVMHKIHVKLGSTLGGNDLLDQVIDYDATNLTLPQNYTREEDMVSIVLGEYLNTSVFYCDIILEDSLGNFSVVTSCQSDQ